MNGVIDRKMTCEKEFMCPAVGKCRVAGVFTRKETRRCVCRDLIAGESDYERAHGKNGEAPSA